MRLFIKLISVFLFFVTTISIVEAQVKTFLVTNFANDDPGEYDIQLDPSNRIRLKPGGNIGINTADPLLKLDVRGNGATLGLANSAAWDHMYFFHDGSTAFMRTGGTETGLAFQINPGGSTASYGGQSYPEVMRLLGNGNVGIGTTSPTEKLHVNGKINSLATKFISPAGGGDGEYIQNLRQISSDPFGLAFFAGGGTTGKMNILGNGNVGIGTTSPTDKLHINGIGRFTSGLKVDGSNFIDFGFGVSGKEGNAGRIGYQTFTSNALDIVGAGTTSANRKIKLWSEGGLEVSGTMGVGTAPVSDIQLKVKGSFNVSNVSGGTVFHVSAGKQLVFVGDSAYIQYNATLNNPNSPVQQNNFSLWVSKGVVSEDYAVAGVNEWDDYVFNEDYDLPKLEKVAAFVKTNKHLPNIPSEAEVKKNGYSMHLFNRGILKTTEELTLYIIEQDQKIKEQNKKISELEKEVAALKSLEARIKALEATQNK